jgi:hypothetical protein
MDAEIAVLKSVNSPEKALKRFGPSTTVGADTPALYLYTRIPQSKWWVMSSKRSKAAVDYVSRQIEVYWNAYEGAVGRAAGR